MKKLEQMTVPELRKIAKSVGKNDNYNVSGYSSMKKIELIKLLTNYKLTKAGKIKEENKNPKSDYIKRIKEGSLIAFKFGYKAISGKVKEIGDSYLIETKNGNMFRIKAKDIIWVRTGDRWPKFVFELLKGNNADGSQRNRKEDSRNLQTAEKVKEA